MIFGISTLNQVYVCETQWIFETFFFHRKFACTPPQGLAKN
jgi:hypothetical protein